MNATQKELFRLAILRLLNRNRSRYGLGVVSIAHALREFSFTEATFGGDPAAFNDAIADALQYLTDKGWVEEALKQVSAENRAWRITGAGIALADEQALK